MRLLFVADGRSPTALNWIRYFTGLNVEVHLASTFPCHPLEGLASFEVIPAAFSQVKVSPPADTKKVAGEKGLLWGASTLKLRTAVRQWLGPVTLPAAARKLAAYIDRVQPDLVHAIRIPYEGMLAALAVSGMDRFNSPLLISVWGNDFTLHARSNPWMARLTRLSLQRASALHTDCFRDARLAQAWGFDAARPSVVLPGGGGIQLDLFTPPEAGDLPTSRNDNPPLTVINPRGFRAYVRNDTFFRSIPLILERLPQTRFLCSTMAGDKRARRWVSDLGLEQAVTLLPAVPRQDMPALYRRSQVAVSPTIHDGTPNTLLESMACGCFPVAGDLESLREWITPGVNGLLIDPGDPQMLADAVVLALQDPALRQAAAQENRKLVEERADYTVVMRQAWQFYRDLCEK